MAEIRGEFVLLMDQLVLEAVRGVCRKASGLDFDKLEGEWVEQDAFNAYLEKLRERMGDQGPYIIGTRIPEMVDKIVGLRKDFPTLEDVVKNWGNVYLANNRGENVGYYKAVMLEGNEISCELTSPLDEGFHLGVMAGAIRLYKRKLARAETIEKIAETGKSVFKYTW